MYILDTTNVDTTNVDTTNVENIITSPVLEVEYVYTLNINHHHHYKNKHNINHPHHSSYYSSIYPNIHQTIYNRLNNCTNINSNSNLLNCFAYYDIISLVSIFFLACFSCIVCRKPSRKIKIKPIIIEDPEITVITEAKKLDKL